MKPDNQSYRRDNRADTCKEIILFTGTSFSSREFILKDKNVRDAMDCSQIENLEKACWAGLLNELLPELVGNPSANASSFIWHIMSGEHFLRISMGPYPQHVENENSIDPYFFLIKMIKN